MKLSTEMKRGRGRGRGKLNLGHFLGIGFTLFVYRLKLMDS